MFRRFLPLLTALAVGLTACQTDLRIQSAGVFGQSSTAGRLMFADISRYQASFDPIKYRAAGFRFIMMKVSGGKLGPFHVDPKWAPRRDPARRAGLIVGGYHFARPERSTPEAQCLHFLKHFGLGNGSVAMLDLEWRYDGFTTARRIAWAERWLRCVDEKSAARVIIYVPRWFMPVADWRIARYPNVASAYRPAPVWSAPWYRWTAWQFTNGVDGPLPHKAAGISCPCDLNLFEGTYAGLVDFIAAPTAPKWPRLLKAGMSGPDVLEWKRRLRELGFGGFDVDSPHFGAGTKAATTRFQSTHRLTADALVGPGTWYRAWFFAPWF